MVVLSSSARPTQTSRVDALTRGRQQSQVQASDDRLPDVDSSDLGLCVGEQAGELLDATVRRLSGGDDLKSHRELSKDLLLTSVVLR